MSKERARRRAEREREDAIRTAARAAAQERRERQQSRRRALRAATTDRVRLTPREGRPVGVLASRSRWQAASLLAAYLLVNVIVWVLRPDWPARFGALVVSLLTFPVLRLLIFGRR